MVHADETGWPEQGQHTTIWTVSTCQTIYVHHGRRTPNEAIDGILGADFGGTIVADCYAAYDVRPVLPKRTSARMPVGEASPGSPTMTTISSTVGAMPTPHGEWRNSTAPWVATGHQSHKRG
ncbi:MAG: IS66 family transposase [Chloroflexota bacterium]